jgi:PAS domain S-box-containing protein
MPPLHFRRLEMKDEHKAKKELTDIDELESLRQRVAELESEKVDRKILEEALRESEERFGVIFDNLRDGLLLADKETMKFLMGNSAIHQMLGYSPEELKHLGVRDIHPEETLPSVINQFEELARGEIKVARDIPVRRKCGSVLYADISSSFPIVLNKKECVMGVFREVTERKRAEEALRDSETRYRQLFATVPDAIFIFDAATRQFIDLNESASRLYGYTRDEFLKMKQGEITAEPQLSDATIKETLATGKVIKIPLRYHKRKDGTVFPVEISGGTFLLAGRSVLFAAVRDISKRMRAEEELGRHRDHLEDLVKERTTELERAIGALRAEIARRKQTEEAQREAEKKYHSLFENAREGIYQSTPEGRYFTVNPAMAKSYGYYSPEEMIASIDSIDHQIFVIPEKRQELKGILETKGEENDFEVEQRRKDGSTFWASLNVHVVYAEDGSILYWEGRSVDITKRKRAEEALKQSKEQLRFLSSRLLEAQEEERKRIAGELHDSIGQSLAAIKFNVENVLAETGKELNGRIVNSLQQIIPLVQNSMEEVRRIYTGLRPSMLDDLGIIATIGWFCREYQKTYTGICFENQIRIEEEEIPELLKIVIFRIVQEALNNIAKHSGAESVDVCLERIGGYIKLAIEDNGKGFDVDSALVRGSHEKGFGITGMKERTEFAGGTFSIESVVGKGTTIHAIWPSNPIFG